MPSVKPVPFARRWAVPVSIAASFVASDALAAPASFNLDAPNSFLILGGDVGGAQITQQGNGSLRATYSGNVLANLSPNAIQFVSGNVADAGVTGNWQPLADGSAGNAPADYGGRFPTLIVTTTFFAVRDLKVETSSASTPLSPAGTFSSSAVNVTATSGDAAFRNGTLGQTGTASLVGSSGANQATADSTLNIVRNGSTATATILVPASANFVSVDPTLGTITLRLNGQLLGTVTSIGGDTNFDRVVDIDDFGSLASNFNTAGSWLAGDFDGTGTIDIDDFGVLAANFNQSAPATVGRAAVPEPSAVAVVALIATRRPRRER